MISLLRFKGKSQTADKESKTVNGKKSSEDIAPPKDSL